MMSQFRFGFNQSARWLVSLSLTLAPFYGLPASAESPAAVVPGAATETEYSQGQRLLLDLEELLDRALYPDVPRKGPLGVPSTSELNQIQFRIAKLKQSYTSGLKARIEALNDEQREYDMVRELNTFYSAVQRFEGLKIILGLPTQEDKWDEQYALSLPITSLSQLNFIGMISAQSESFVPLPGAVIDIERLAHLKESISGYNSRLENINEQWFLKLYLNPAFADYYERTLFTTNLSTRNVLLYAIQWSAHRLYDSQALTLNLQRQQPMSSLPEPSLAMRKRFLSMRVKRAQVLQRSKKTANTIMKTLMVSSILDALHAARAKNAGWMIDERFARAFRDAAANQEYLKENIDVARLGEEKQFYLALSSLINLMEINDWKNQMPYLVYESARLCIRSTFLANSDSHFELKPGAREGFENFIDQKAQMVTQELMNHGLAKAIANLDGKTTAASVRDQSRQRFQAALQSASGKMENFAHEEINFTYLLGAEKGSISLLHPSPFVNSIVEATEQQHSFIGAYNAYKHQLYTFMQTFKYKSELPKKMSLEAAGKLVDEAEWNPSSLNGVLDPQYIAELNSEAAQRTKDLKDLIRVGQILKFNAYEKYAGTPRNKRHGIYKKVTPSALGMDETMLGTILGSDKQAYLEEMKKDLLKAAPILGGTVDSQSQNTVWETLNRADLSSDYKYQMVDGQFVKVMSQINDNQARIDQALAHLDATPDDSINGATKDLQILITRAAQLSVGLDSFAGFDSYYEEVRNELTLPGFMGREWNRFASWTDTVSWYMMAFWAVKALAGPRIKVVGTAVNTTAKLLAPVLGVNMSRFNYILFGVLGLAIADKGVTYYEERSRAAVLRAFFECGSGAPCVALYSDVSLQLQRQAKAVTDAITTIVTIVAIYFGIKYLAMGAGKLFMRDIPYRRQVLQPYLKRLGLDAESVPLTQAELEKAVSTQVARARSETNPFKAAAEEALTKHAAKQVRTAILDEAVYWSKQNARFAAAAKALGLDGKVADWKSMADLANAWGRLNGQFKAGQISYFRYQQLMQDIVDMKVVLDPVYAHIKANKANALFMDGVWSRGRNQLGIELSASLEAQKSLNVSAEFEKAVSQFSGTASTKATAARDAEVDALIESVGKDLEQNPTRAANKFQNLVHKLMGRVRK